MEGFEDQWHIFTGTFMSFIEQIWKPEMAKLRKEQKSFDVIYREIGVVLSRSKPRQRAHSHDSLEELDFSDANDSEDQADEEDSEIVQKHGDEDRSAIEAKHQFVRRRSI